MLIPHTTSPIREVFAARLREIRVRAGLTQLELADRMTRAGRPLDRTAVVRIEGLERDVSLEEAIALAAELRAVPADLLSPADDSLVELTAKQSVDRAGMRNWLRTGQPIPVRPLKPRSEDVPLLEANFERVMTHHAAALIHAVGSNDKAGIRAALDAIRDLIDSHRQTLIDRERGILDGRLPSAEDHVYVIGA